jgi:predicted N-formylglutamate amidohydrolase
MARAETRRTAVVLSCEHGGHDVPARYRALFRRHRRVLDSHRGWDPGALALARDIARVTHAPLVATTVSRLLVECNRSLDHERLFSEFVRGLDEREKVRILERHYHPHRRAVQQMVTRALRPGRRVVHIGVHTFTPVFHGRRRDVDVGVLYDPHRAFERASAATLVEHLRTRLPGLRVRRNAPYRGWADGLTTSLRGVFPAGRYAGIELEVGQALVRRAAWRRIRREIGRAIGRAFLASSGL